MNVFLSLLKKELRTCFLSPIAYVVMFFFWVFSGGAFVWVLYQMAEGKTLTFATNGIFAGLVLNLAVPFFVPLITMRLFAEERKLGTLESLLTTSVRVPELVLAKFAASLVFYAVLWLPALVYVAILIRYCPADVLGFPDAGALWTASFGVILVGGLYIAVVQAAAETRLQQIIRAFQNGKVRQSGPQARCEHFPQVAQQAEAGDIRASRAIAARNGSRLPVAAQHAADCGG